jgi:hypothetical protein
LANSRRAFEREVSLSSCVRDCVTGDLFSERRGTALPTTEGPVVKALAKATMERRRAMAVFIVSMLFLLTTGAAQL